MIENEITRGKYLTAILRSTFFAKFPSCRTNDKHPAPKWRLKRPRMAELYVWWREELRYATIEC